MAPGRPDPEILRAIRIHTGTYHGRGISDDQIAREHKGRLAEVTRVTYVPETPESPAWIICRECPEGAQRYRVDVFARPTRPPARHVTAIRRHMASAHGLTAFSARRIYRQRSSRALVTYLPTRPLAGAQMICALCPEGRNHIVLEEPPYGDARSFAWLTMLDRPLRETLVGLTPTQCAERLEAHHRGIVIPKATQASVERALGQARSARSDDELTELETGLRRLMLHAVARGQGITHAIQALVELIDTDPTGYACELARAIPGWERHLSLPRPALARQIRERYAPIERDRRTLWRYWHDTPRATREAAIARGRRA